MESASPASLIKGLGPPPEDDIWHFLEHIDAPRWADLHEEAVLTAAGLEGDDPWFHTSHENHEKSLDELAEETGTLTLAQSWDEEAGASPLSMGSPQVGHRRAASPSPAKSALTEAFSGSLHRIDLRRLGGGAQRLHSRPRRVTPEEEAASSMSPLEPTTSEQPTAVSIERTPDSVQASGAKLAPELLGALAGIMQYGADSPDAPPSKRSNQADAEVGGAEGLAGCRSGEGEGPSDNAPSSSGQRVSSGRGMQLPVAAASRPGALEGQTDGDHGIAGGGEELRPGGRKKGRQKSLGDALRVPKQAGEHESNSSETRKRSPLVPSRPRKSADSLTDSSEKVKLAFGRRVEPPEQQAAARRQAHQAVAASPPLPLKKDKPSVHAVSKELARAAAPIAVPRTFTHPTAVSKLSAKSTLRPLYETPPSSARGAAGPGQARTKLGRTVAARTDTGQRQPGSAGGGAGARGPLATLANGNTSRQPVRSASAKGGGDKKAVRVQGPGLRHVAVGFTAAPKGGAEAIHMQRFSSAAAKASHPRASISPANEVENRAPPSTSAPRLQAGALPEEDQDIAAMLAQHNRKFKVKPAYEPRMHSVRDTKEWERLTGKVYYTLDPGEREEANEEINQMKQSRAPLLTL